MAERKDRMALLSRYNKFYTKRYERKSNINLNVEQWAADALIESYGLPECYDLLEYYFSVAQTPTWKYFANYADKVIDAREQYQQDLKAWNAFASEQLQKQPFLCTLFNMIQDTKTSATSNGRVFSLTELENIFDETGSGMPYLLIFNGSFFDHLKKSI